jgi:hypothetical protein
MLADDIAARQTLRLRSTPAHDFDPDAALPGSFGTSMKAKIPKTLCIALLLCSPVHGEETAPNHRHGLLTRVACPAIREAVKLYGETAAEQWARSHGVSEPKIEEAKRCLK